MPPNLPTITIITPSYNQAQYIEETIDSVLSQGYPGLEYIVLDGGSTDGTVELLRRYDHYLKWFSQKDNGQSDALNRGFRMARGEVLAFINSDDRYEPGALNAVGGFFASHPQAHWVTGKCRVIDSHSREIRRLVTAYKNFWLRFKSYQVLLVLDYVSQPATFWRRVVIEKAGLFDENLHFSMDYDFSLRVGRYFRLFLINSYLASYRIHSSSKSDQITDHFNTDFSIARRYTDSQVLNMLHSFHNSLIIKIYNQLQ